MKKIIAFGIIMTVNGSGRKGTVAVDGFRHHIALTRSGARTIAATKQGPVFGETLAAYATDPLKAKDRVVVQLEPADGGYRIVSWALHRDWHAAKIASSRLALESQGAAQQAFKALRARFAKPIAQAFGQLSGIPIGNVGRLRVTVLSTAARI